MHNVFCPKCGHNSGDDWSQCEGSCPMSMSPHYKSPAQEVEKVSDPCEQGFHWIECEGCKMCGRSWDEAMEHAKQMSSKCNCDLIPYEHEVCEHSTKKEG